MPVYCDEGTDTVRLSYVDPTGWVSRNRRRGDFTDEWGCLRETGDETMGHVKTPAIGESGEAHRHVLPDPHLSARWEGLDAQMRKHEGRYVVGNAQYLCHDRLTEDAAAFQHRDQPVGGLLDEVL